MAAASIANIVKSSLGPVGLDKMLVDDIGVCVTSRARVESLMKWCPSRTFLIAHLVIVFCETGCDHHQRRRDHPEAAGGGAPSCQGPVWTGWPAGQGGWRRDHICGECHLSAHRKQRKGRGEALSIINQNEAGSQSYSIFTEHTVYVSCWTLCASLLKVILAAEFLKSADELVKQKIHPTSVISGYRLACK